MIMGITCSSVFQSTYNLTFSLQEKKMVGKYTVEFNNLDTLKKGNFEELLATFIITENKFNQNKRQQVAETNYKVL